MQDKKYSFKIENNLKDLNNKAHSAGYDAYMAAMIYLYYKASEGDKFLSMFKNRVKMFGIQNFMIDLENEEDIVIEDQVVLF